MAKTIIFIHGMFLTPKSWGEWVQYFEELGYRCIAPAWPCHDGDPTELRANIPPGLGDLTLADLIASIESVVDQCDEKPILIGHSLGGLIAQVLVNRGRAAAGVCISTVAPNAMLSFEWTFIKSTFPILNPLVGNTPQEMDADGFHTAFTNTLTLDAARALHHAYAVHESRNVLRTALGEAGHVDLKKPHAPLLFLTGVEDAIVPDSLVEKNYEAYAADAGLKNFQRFSGRDHIMYVEPGWEEVIDYTATWLQAVTEPIPA